MSAAFYNKMAATATSLLTKFGQTMTLSRVSGDAHDPILGTVSGGSTTTYSPIGLFSNYSDDMIDGTRIQQGDRLLILDNTVEPQSGDTIQVDGNEWNVIDWMAKKPSTVAIVYFVQLRQ